MGSDWSHFFFRWRHVRQPRRCRVKPLLLTTLRVPAVVGCDDAMTEVGDAAIAFDMSSVSVGARRDAGSVGGGVNGGELMAGDVDPETDLAGLSGILNAALLGGLLFRIMKRK